MPKRKRCPGEAIDCAPLSKVAANEQLVESTRRLSHPLPASVGTDEDEHGQPAQRRLPPSPPTSDLAIQKPNAVKSRSSRPQVRPDSGRCNHIHTQRHSERVQEGSLAEGNNQKRESGCEFEDSAQFSPKSKSARVDSPLHSAGSKSPIKQSIEPASARQANRRRKPPERVDTVPPAVEEAKDRLHNPVSWWAEHKTWPPDFATSRAMASSSSANKRPRASASSESGIRRSYSKSRKHGDVPEQYTPDYENHILTKGLHMDLLTGKELSAPDTSAVCAELLKITRRDVGFTLLPQHKISQFIFSCSNRNEAMVNREVTPLIIPSVNQLRLLGVDEVENVVDEVNTNWPEGCVIAGPRPRPDLAVGLAATAFSQVEMDKLKSYRTVDNWTRFTDHLYFPFLMCEVKCGVEGLDKADRQNMHSCSVAVKAMVDLHKAASKLNPKLNPEHLSGRTLVFSISHNDQDARLYGHFARLGGQDGSEWTYHRYRIQKFDLSADGLLAIHNFVQNLFKLHLPGFTQSIRTCLEALPDSSGLSFAASSLDLDKEAQTPSQEAGVFKVPTEPASFAVFRDQIDDQQRQLEERNREIEERKRESAEQQRRFDQQAEQMNALIQQLAEQSKQLAEQSKQQAEQARQSKEREDRLLQMLSTLTEAKK